MGFSMTELVESKGWKMFMAKLYGWGASVVIVGAMFKIMHWPGAGPMLVVGLSVEALIFFFSAFEPLHEEIDWTLAYPELAGLKDDELFEEEHSHSNKNKQSALEKFDEMINSAQLTPNMFEKLGQGLKNLNETSSKISQISDASVATQEYVTNIKSASSSFNNLTDAYSKSVEGLNESAGILSKSYSKVSDIVEASGQELANSYVGASQSINNSGKQLADTYSHLVESLKSGSGSVVDGNKSYVDQLGSLTKNLSALNAVYELQLQGTNDQLKASEKLYGGLHDMMENLNSSVEETKKYREEVSKLGNNLAALNTVYGNMLAAMNVGMKA